MLRSKEILKLSIEAHLHPNTVIRVLKGELPSRENTVEAIRAAAGRLGISLPEIGKVVAK